MPSPIGHALGGMAIGALIAGRPGWRIAGVCALAGALPDLDFLLPLQHRGPTHSLGAAALVFAGTFTILALRSRAGHALRTASAVALAYASHVLLDWLGADSSTPRGVLAFWPMSDVFYVSGWDVFNAVDRRYWIPGFWTRNALALARELVILVPLVAISALAGRRVHSYRQPGVAPPRA